MSSIMTIIAFIILMCYGGGFGTMPAFTADYFGPKNMGPIYGLMLTAWSFASVFGPLYIARTCVRPPVTMPARCTRSRG
jgi:OFA family oxalate/formate antiporter-like MFS transporter